MNVLLIEDNEDTATALAALFEMEEIGFRWLRSGTEAMNLLAAGSLNARADVLVLDLMLPDMSGVKLVHQLSSVTALPPVVLYSAASQAELLDAAHEIGAAATLRKPCEPRDLVSTARRAALTAPTGQPV